MQKFTKTVGWGEALLLEVHHDGRGLNPLVKTITEAAGQLGVRNTYAALYELEDAPTSDDPKDYFRAWLVLVALGQDPEAWGVRDDAVPVAYDVNKLRDLIYRSSGWLPAMAGHLADVA